MSYAESGFGPLATLLDAVAMNGTAAERTSAALECVGYEYMRLQYALALDGTGLAAGNDITFRFLCSHDGGTSYHPMMKAQSYDSLSQSALTYTLVAADIAATLADGDIGAIEIIGLTHIKVVVSCTGSPDADNLIICKTRPVNARGG